MRQKTTTVTLFKFDELSEKAKAEARDWYVENIAYDGDWYDPVYEDFKEICKIIGITLKPDDYNPGIYFQGFSYQGDGASFVGTYRYVNQAHKKIREYAPQDKELHRIADTLKEMQRRVMHKLVCTITLSKGSGVHSGCMEFSFNKDYLESLEKTVKEALVDLADWLFKRLRDEHDAIAEDDHVDEDINCNEEWEFYEDGTFAG